MKDDELKTYRTGDSGITAPVTVPLLQALITGALGGIAAGVIVAVLHVNLSPWKAGAAVWALVTLASWLSYRGRWQWVVERVMGIDINHDGYIGAPEPAPEPLRVELLQDGARRGDFIDLPYPEKLHLLASGLESGRQFSMTAWTGAGQLFSRAEFEELRGELLRRGLARWKNAEAPAQGIELTPAGRAILKRIADTPTPPGRA